MCSRKYRKNTIYLSSNEPSFHRIKHIMIRKMASSQTSEDIVKSLKSVVENILKAVERRPPHLPALNPRLVAVSKTKPVKDIITAYNQGQRHFGENYVTELEEKATSPLILDACKEIKWHMIGHLQRNKANKVTALPNLYMVETVDSAKLAETLNKQWEKFKKSGTLCILVQVNTSGESNKSGCNPEDVANLVTFIKTKCPQLTFSGLMTIGAFGHDPALGPNQDFVKLVECRENLCKELDIDLSEVELSMGMSSDYEHAIELGSSNIRVGSTIFGARNVPANSNNTNSPASDSQKSNVNPGDDSTNDSTKASSKQTNDANQANTQSTSTNIYSSTQSSNHPIKSPASDSISELNAGVKGVNIDDRTQ